MRNPRDIIKKPIITEETSMMAEENKYVFEVDKKANKIEVKYAIEEIFGVDVVSVNTQNVPGKPKRYGRYSGHTNEWKKAIVKLSPESKKIEFFEGV